MRIRLGHLAKLFAGQLLFAASGSLSGQQPSFPAPLPTFSAAVDPTPALPPAQPKLDLSTLPQTPTPSSSSDQQPASPPQTQPQTPDDPRSQAQRELKQQESQRMLGVVPAFNSVISGHAVAISPKQKFNLFFHSVIDPFQFVVVGADAGLEQAEDQYPEYHYGAAGFARRYGAAYADDFDGNFFGNALLPSLLHQDPRYFRRGHGTIVRRILYSAATTVITHGDNGKLQPNYSNVAGNFIGGAISNAYYPASDRGFGLTIERGATVTAEGALGSLALEFYPDVAAWWHNRHSRKDASSNAAP